MKKIALTVSCGEKWVGRLHLYQEATGWRGVSSGREKNNKYYRRNREKSIELPQVVQKESRKIDILNMTAAFVCSKQWTVPDNRNNVA